jgi:hypothetical protein
MRTPDRVAGGGLFAIELLALGAAVFGAWYCGELVDRQRRALSSARAGAAARAQAGARAAGNRG